MRFRKLAYDDGPDGRRLCINDIHTSESLFAAATFKGL